MDLSNPLPWPQYVPYILGLFLIVLVFSGILCLAIYAVRDCIEHFSKTNLVQSTYASRRSFVTLYAIVVTMVATMTALTSPALVLYWSVKQDKRAVNNLTYELIKEWRGEILTKSAYDISDYFRRKGIEEKQASYDLFDFSQRTKNRELRMSLRRILNYCEAVATAYYRGDVDKELVKSYFETAFVIYHNRLLPYIKRVQRMPKHADVSHQTTALVYSDFDKLIEKWKAEATQNNQKTLSG